MFLKDNQVLELFRSYPENIHFPRDNEQIHKTKDLLFIVNLLLNWKDEYTLLGLYIDKERNYQYAFTIDKYNYFDNNTGEELKLKCGDNFLQFKQWFKKSTVKKYVRQFFSFRYLLGRSIFDSDVTVNGIDIVKRDILLKDNLENLNNTLTYKLNTEISLNLFQKKDRKSLTKLICPFCGKVEPIIGRTGYPYWTINLECLTFVSEFNYVLCPKCLGLFSSYSVNDENNDGCIEFIEEMYKGDVSKWLIKHPSTEDIMKKYEKI